MQHGNTRGRAFIGLLSALVGLLALAACTAAPAPQAALTPQAVQQALTASGLPVADVRVDTAEGDPNKLLGRPGQYVLAVRWRDTRAPAEASDAVLEGFADEAALKARADYVEALGKGSPLLVQYVFTNPARRVLVRAPKDLTPEQAAQYKDWLAKL